MRLPKIEVTSGAPTDTAEVSAIARVAQLVRALDFYVGLFLFCPFLVPPSYRRVTRVLREPDGRLDRTHDQHTGEDHYLN